MNPYEQEVKTAYEALAKRPLSSAEVADIILTFRQLAAFLIECGRDEALCAKLGRQPRAGPRAADNTTRNDGKPLQMRASTNADPPTASSRDASSHRDSSASYAPTSPAGRPADAPRPVTTGATVDGSP